MRSPAVIFAIISVGCSGDPSAPNANSPAIISITGVQSTQVAGEKVPVAAKAEREGSAPIAGLLITFVSSIGGTAVPATAVTDANGVARTTWTVPETTGTAVLRANGGASSVEVVTDVKPAAAARINKLAGEGQDGFEGEVLPNSVRVSVTDAFGNAIAGRSVTFVVTAGGGSVTASSVITAPDGSASTEWRLGVGSTPNTLQVQTSDLTPATFTATSRTPAGTFALTGGMSAARRSHTATLLRDGRVLVTGGQSTNGGSGLATAELYDPTTSGFTRTANNMTVARVGHSATLLSDGRVLIAGGSDGSRVDLFDPATNSFVQTGDLVDAQSWQEGTLLRGGEVLLTGGRTQSGREARAELYDPATGMFRYTGPYANVIATGGYNGLVDISATLLSDGKVLIASLPRAEVYNPATGTFAATGSMLTNTGPSYISGRTATLLISGKVLLTGGHHEDRGRFSQAELYDPSTGQFVNTMDMPYPRTIHTATLLASGKVLIAGGESEGGSNNTGCNIFSLAAADVYDASGTTRTAAAPMKVPREAQRATLLKDGRVLITGGFTFRGGLNCTTFQVTILNSAELYSERP
ncbi:MAG TPA: kelch repeat-containing protein [Gemmatimonadaceae bacterium]|nr:kelch repeat-containing protein [Gemmatimonadaceae bacterium]